MVPPGVAGGGGGGGILPLAKGVATAGVVGGADATDPGELPSPVEVMVG
jgi:hypothetical protein